MPFRNLYFLIGSKFQDYNFTDLHHDSFHCIESDGIRKELDSMFQPPADSLSLAYEPLYLESILTFTLGPGTAGSFIREHPGTPAQEEDFYRSKLYQYLYDSIQALIEVRFRFCEADDYEMVEQRLQQFCEALPHEALADLSGFHWEEFWADLQKSRHFENLERVLGNLQSYVPANLEPPSKQATGTVPSAALENAAISERTKRRNEFLESKLGGMVWSDLDLARNGGPDYKTIKRYRRGDVTTRTGYVRGKIAQALRCEFSEVPE